MARCLYPINLKQQGVVPCGRCDACLDNYRSGWALRLLLESQMHKKTYFLTLTYNQDHVPIVDKIRNQSNYLTLKKSHIQLYIKRLRKERNLRYYFCGEYGEQGNRPHYHGIIYLDDTKTDFTDDYKFFYSNWGKYSKNRFKKHENPEDFFTSFGFIDLEYAKPTDYLYVLKYLRKSQGNIDYKLTRDMNNQQHDFALMSKRPALGSQISMNQLINLFTDNAPTLNGTTYLIPKLYKEFMKLNNPDAFLNWQDRAKKYLPPHYQTEEHYREVYFAKHKGRR